MTAPTGAPRAEPFFLKSAAGRRFCLFHPPVGACRGALLYVHPFAEEMNRSRRMAALQARQLAALGYGVLLLDLTGCGDSGGDFNDARWALWKDDLALGAAWLAERLDRPLTLWGLRLGALLAADYARAASHPVHALILWQPVQNGAAFLNQFLRLRVAGAMLDDGQNPGQVRTSTTTLRQALQARESIEIAGYDLAPELAAALDALDPLEAMTPPCPVHWFEAVGAADAALPTGAARVGAAWQARGVKVRQQAVHCPPFWTTPEIVESPAWLAATSAALREAGDGV
jgi:exosortase A-associated hydrolase 2